MKDAQTVKSGKSWSVLGEGALHTGSAAQSSDSYTFVFPILLERFEVNKTALFTCHW